MPEGWTESMLRDRLGENQQARQSQEERKSRLRRIRKTKRNRRDSGKIEEDEKIRKQNGDRLPQKAKVAQSEYAGMGAANQRKREGFLRNGDKGKQAIQQKQKDKKQLEDAIEDAGKEYRRRRKTS